MSDPVKNYLDNLLTLEEAAAILKIKVKTLRTRIHRGQIRTVRPSPKVTYVLRTDIEKYLGLDKIEH